MSRELKIILSLAAGLVAARALVLIADAIAESVERASLYRGE
jgi:hypothetical protein